ncbi:MAG: antiporter [Nitrospirota bacterium]|nr:antiporter [Nitrospirota bacterium]
MADIRDWRVEDNSFWESTGKKIATRNLVISIPCLLNGFAIWLMWSILTVQMLNIGFPFTQPQLFTISAIAGLTGATLRIPSSFMIRLAGGRNTIFFTTALLMIPAIGTAFALQDINTPLWIFQALAFLSGFGGGNFASSMSNISFFFPKRVQGTSLGFNAGLGNFGVTTMQILIPLVMTFALLGPISGDPMVLQKTSGTLIGKIPAGSQTWIQNGGFVWLIFLVPLAFASWFGMNNIRTESVSPDIGNPVTAFFKITYLLVIGFIVAGVGLYLLLPAPTGLGLLSKWIVIPAILFFVLMAMRYLTPPSIQQNLARQFKIFNNKHTWVMSVIYTMTFGSFIGYSAAFALSIKVIFGFQHVLDPATGVWSHAAVNANGPSALTFAWIGPFIGAIIRPPGGWLSDKLGGARVTQYCSYLMMISAGCAAYYMNKAFQVPNPEIYFWPFFFSFMGLFLGAGIGNGSTFRTIAMVFNEEQAGPVLGWTSAVAAYGAYLAPQIIGEQIKAGTPQNALIGFGIFYAVCCVLNWWYYLGPKADIKNP